MITVLKIVVGMLVIGFGLMCMVYWLVDQYDKTED